MSPLSRKLKWIVVKMLIPFSALKKNLENLRIIWTWRKKNYREMQVWIACLISLRTDIFLLWMLRDAKCLSLVSSLINPQENDDLMDLVTLTITYFIYTQLDKSKICNFI